MPTPEFPPPEHADRHAASDAAFDALPPDPDLDAHLARLLRAAPRCTAPDGFTARVMGALPPRSDARRPATTPRHAPATPASPPRLSPARPAAVRAATRGTAALRRLRSASLVTFLLVIVVIGSSRLAMPALYADVAVPAATPETTPEAEVTNAQVVVARAQVELALSILGSAHRKAESDAERLLAP